MSDQYTGPNPYATTEELINHSADLTNRWAVHNALKKIRNAPEILDHERIPPRPAPRWTGDGCEGMGV
jgi:hypothetical protein